MLNGTTPTILFHGRSYANNQDIPLFIMFPIQFLFGLGGLDITRGTKVICN